MIDIITSDLEKLIENSIIELNKKIREEISNNLLKSISKDSIYELNDIKNFGKLSDPTLSHIYNFIENKYSIYSNIELFPYHHVYLKLDEGEYPILMCNEITNGSEQIHYITNIIDGLMLNNDDILFLILIAIKINKKRKQPIYKPCSIVVKYLKENNFIDTESDNEYILNKLLKYYFASVHDNKIKGFEFDKLIKNNKLLEDENYDFIKEKNNFLDKIIKLEEENYIYYKEISTLQENAKTYEYNDKLQEDNDILLDRIIKLEEENNLYFKNIIYFEEEFELKKNNENKIIEELRKEVNKITEEYDKTKIKLDKIKEKNTQQKIITSNLVEDNNYLVVSNNKLKLKLDKVKEKNIQQKIITSNLVDDNNKLTEDNNKLVEDNNKLTEDNNKSIEDNNKLVEYTNNLVEDNNNLVEDNNNLVEYNNKLKEDNGKLKEDNNNLVKELEKNLKENIKTTEEKQKLIDKIVDLMDEKNKLVEIINILSDKDINSLIIESDITNIQQILLEIKEERNNIYIENNRLKNLNNKLEINENQVLINYDPIIKKYEKTQMNIISFYNLIICLFILYSFYFF